MRLLFFQALRFKDQNGPKVLKHFEIVSSLVVGTDLVILKTICFTYLHDPTSR